MIAWLLRIIIVIIIIIIISIMIILIITNIMEHLHACLIKVG